MSSNHKKNIYIFILSPPNSGSTLLTHILRTSPEVSSFECRGEGLNMYDDTINRWDSDRVIRWEKLKHIFHAQWNLNKRCLLEKSPPCLLHAAQIVKHFEPVYFLITVRNPYACCEGILRRKYYSCTVRESAEFVIRNLAWQRYNKEKIKNAYAFTYEELTNDPNLICKNILDFIPALVNLDVTREFSIHSMDGRFSKNTIISFNQKSLNNLLFPEIRIINAVFRHHRDILDYWGYDLIGSQRKILSCLNFRKIWRRRQVIFPFLRRYSHINKPRHGIDIYLKQKVKEID